jgi:hypothetical protein
MLAMRACRKARRLQGGAAGRRLTVRQSSNAKGLPVPRSLRGMREGKIVLTIKAQDERARFERGAAAMISDLQKLVVLPVAMILFLCAASTSPGLTWRGSAPVQIVAAR